MKRSFGMILFLILITLFISSGLTQQDSGPKPDLITIDFRDTDIGDALRLLAKQYGLNIILSQDVKGPITIRFSNITVDEAIDAIVTINGFAYTKRDNVIKVTSPAAAEPSTKMFRLNNATASEIRDSLKNAKVLSNVGSIDTDERSNAVLVTDLPGVLATVERLVKAMDSSTPQVRIEAKVIETVLGKNDNLGVDWTIKATAKGAKRPTTAPFEALSGMGMDKYLPIGNLSNATFPVSGSAAGPYAGSPYGFPFAGPSSFVYGTLDFSEFTMVLELLKKRSNTTILSNPAITTLDNREANVLVGTRIPIPNYELNEQTGTYVITGYSEEEVGINLRVTPRVNPEGYIKLDIHPEVSSITGYTGPNNERPIISTREADTQVQIKDGETVVIGGLIKEEIIDTVKRVPFLGYIPVLGFPFKKTEYSKQKTDLLIFITAHILSDEKKRDITYKAMSKSVYKDQFKEEIADYKEKTKKNFKPKKVDSTEAKALKLEKR